MLPKSIYEGCHQLLWMLIVCVIIQQGCAQDFGYEGNTGPSHWGEKFQHCVGKHQSPINIDDHRVRRVSLPPMVFKNFDSRPNSAILKNNGHTVILTLQTDEKPMITGGPLIGDYEFAQLHFHWGANDGEGSENTINNNSFPLELHVVFFQSAYGSFAESTEHPDGLAVLSFLYSNAEEDNKCYQMLLDAIPRVKDPHSTTSVKDTSFIKDLINRDLTAYYTYGGSLTTPPCSEVVTWIEFKNTVKLSHDQLEVFRQLNSEHGKLLHNFRPVQPLHGRTIRMNQPTTNIEPTKENQNGKKDDEGSAGLPSFNILLLLSTYNIFIF